MYDCATGRPIAKAAVQFWNLDDGTTVAAEAGGDGRCARANQTEFYEQYGRTTASRLARDPAVVPAPRPTSDRYVFH